MLEYDKTVCKICGKKCKSEKGLIAHVPQIHKIKTKEYYDTYFKTEYEGICIICGKPTKYRGFVEGYWKYHGQCINNNKILMKKYNIRTHTRNDTIAKNKKYECEFCHKTFCLYSGIMRHINQTEICCEFYIKKYKSLELIPDTIKNNTNKNIPGNMVQCEFCHRTFKTIKSMSKHLQKKSKKICRKLYLEKYKNYKNFPYNWNRKKYCIVCNKEINKYNEGDMCRKCANIKIAHNKKRNFKLIKNTKYVKDSKSNWFCEFCHKTFLTKKKLEEHAKNSKCTQKYFDKYRLITLFPWNNVSENIKKCKCCNKIIQSKSEYCRECNNKIIMQNMQMNNFSQSKISKIYNDNYTKKFTNKKFRKQILKEQKNICPICHQELRCKNNIIHLHHIDYDKMNDNRYNLVFLHNSCHGKTNWHRPQYFKELMDYHIELLELKGYLDMLELSFILEKKE